MPINWPPPTAPAWPPPEIGMYQVSDIRVLAGDLLGLGFRLDAPTIQERNTYFRDARCDHGDSVLGRMLVSPSGTRYPFAICNDPAHRDLLVSWPPFYAGFDSGRET